MMMAPCRVETEVRSPLVIARQLAARPLGDRRGCSVVPGAVCHGRGCRPEPLRVAPPSCASLLRCDVLAGVFLAGEAGREQVAGLGVRIMVSVPD